ncbi:aminotransferase [Zopfia rhizophila CBS 207.26]|uniref:Aminotransferase n=1 Tax=Zopfia rhizophila CBS 207.26 TaxID=1314779 RepID=A0A6A6DLI4_9PEZI|nr:aminotransferase [Zopfia rhizophila CBS 207.26]
MSKTTVPYRKMSGPTLSDRGTEYSATQAGETVIWDVISNLWHPQENPDGYVSLGVAENALMHSELRDFLNSKRLLEDRSLTYGDGPTGCKPLRSILSSFLNSKLNPVMPIKPEHIIATNGVTTAIEHSSWALANPGDGILLGRPYYRAFIADIGLRTGVKVVPVSFGEIDPCSPSCVEKYDEALNESNQKGVKIRALMLCHPHNPLGRCYPKETIIELMKLCQKYNIHLISDEIYAFSVWKNTIDELKEEPVGFQSVLSIDTKGIIDPGLAHVLWGMSKDFGANGVRIGFLISQNNEPFLKAVRTCGLHSSPSSLAENAAAEVLGNEEFVERYTKTNQERLSEAYAYGVKKVKEHGMEHVPGVNAAFFLWVNLGKVWREKHPEEAGKVDGEAITDVIFQKMMKNKVYVVTGDAAGAEEPGWFRLVFSQPKDLVDEGIKRIAEAIS